MGKTDGAIDTWVIAAVGACCDKLLAIHCPLLDCGFCCLIDGDGGGEGGEDGDEGDDGLHDDQVERGLWRLICCRELLVVALDL